MEAIIPFIAAFYSHEDVARIVRELERFRKTLPTVPDRPFTVSWYKDSSIYCLYPESIEGTEVSPLRNITKHLKKVKELRCNAVHVLPFLESPMRDKGYDVSDYYKVRKGLGGMGDLMALKQEAHELGIHVFMDLVFNHVSTEHEWFQKAQQGNAHYREFFIYTKETPQFLRKVYRDSAVWAEYLVDGKKTLVPVAFPDFVGELPHWVQGTDGYWYYHTYYPHQIDVNWKNPDVFIELGKVLLFWASRGFNFRFDAIPFIGKSAYKHLNTHNAFTHNLTAVLNILAEQVKPDCIFILETSEKLDSEIEYFGTANTRQAHMLYSFQRTTCLWVSLVTKDLTLLWRQLKKDRHIPMHAVWINFLRNHDDLSFVGVKTSLLADVYKELLPRGKSFGEGYGLGGRTYSLLGSDEERFLMSYFLLASLPGGLLIPYGDEYGMKNTQESALVAEERDDARNINRGKLTREIMQSDKGKRIFSFLARTLEVRQLLRNYLNVWPQKLQAGKGVFAARYTAGTSELIVLVNLTEKPKRISIDTSVYQQISGVNTNSLTKNTVELGSYGGIWLQK